MICLFGDFDFKWRLSDTKCFIVVGTKYFIVLDTKYFANSNCICIPNEYGALCVN